MQLGVEGELHSHVARVRAGTTGEQLRKVSLVACPPDFSMEADTLIPEVVCKDLLVRNSRRRSPTLRVVKLFSTPGPFGPWVVTDDEVPAPRDMNLRMLISGQVRQQASISQMISNICHQITCLFTVMTLEPRDVVSAGTLLGLAPSTPSFPKVGEDVGAWGSTASVKSKTRSSPRCIELTPYYPNCTHAQADDH